MQLVVSWSAADPEGEHGALLWLPFDGTNGSIVFEDSSAFDHQIWSRGGAALSTTRSKFGGSSVSFDGTAKTLSVPATGALVFGKDDFTVEFWVYPTSVTGSATLFSVRETGSNYGPLAIVRDGAALDLYVSENGSSWKVNATGGTLTVNTWHHVAVVRVDDTITMYLGGTSVASGTLTSATTFLHSYGYPIRLGGEKSSGYFAGYMDDLLVYRGARYTANFSVPTSAYSVSPADEEVDLFYPYVLVLLHMEGVDGGTVFYDHSRRGFGVTVGSNVATEADHFKFGSTSYHATGATSGLAIADSVYHEVGSNDFTIEFWARFTDVTTAQTLVTKRSSTAAYGPYHIEVVGGNLSMAASTNGTSWTSQDTTAGAVSVDTWYHIALVRSGTTLKLYLNGTETGSAAISGSLTDNSQSLRIAAEATGDRCFTGYLDEFRFTNGIGRYTGNFAAPTAAFGDVGVKYSGWTPADASNLYAWYDTSYTLNSPATTGTITNLVDLSGNARHITSVSGYQIIDDGVISGRKGSSSGNTASAFLKLPSATGMLSGGSGFAAGASMWRRDYHSGSQMIFFAETSARNITRALLAVEFGGGTDDAPAIYSRRLDGDSPTLLTSSTTIGQETLALVVGGVDLSNQIARVRANGSESVNSSFGTSGTYSATNSYDGPWIGNGNAAPEKVDGFTGGFGEIVVYSAPLSQAQMEKLDGYLAWNWGMVYLLPTNHPYKLVRPTV